MASRRSHDQQPVTAVLGVAPSDLRADLGVVFLRGCAVNIEDVQRFHVNEGGDFQRANAVVRSLGVVA